MAEPLWTARDLAAALETAPSAAMTVPVGGVSIDSRTAEPGDLFVAIKGERMDGHKFVGTAFDKGAAAAIVDRAFDAGSTFHPLFRVADPLDALNALARHARRRTDASVIAVTGSVGKTGTKEMLRTMLSACGPAHASEKSYNNLWGVPLSLARMPQETAFGVFEIGMNHAGEITPLAHLVRPHIAIVTWIAPVHIEFFDSLEGIADAKAEIFEGLCPIPPSPQPSPARGEGAGCAHCNGVPSPLAGEGWGEGAQGGVAILPSDNEQFERLAAHARKKGARVVSFGERKDADARLLAYEPGEDGAQATADILGIRVRFKVTAPGRHLAQNAIAALAAAKLAGAPVEKAAEALARFEVPEGRGRAIAFDAPGGKVLIIDESYNANPASMRAALDGLGARKKFERRIAVLGDMLELGHDGPQFHAELSRAIDINRIDLVFCAGPLMAHLYERLPEIRQGGWADKSEDLRAMLLGVVRGGDAVMIKGSLGSRMGHLANALKQRFSNPAAADEARGTA